MKEFITKLIELLEDNIEITWKHDYSGGRKDAFCEAIDIVERLAEEYNNGWIPCSERLPKDDVTSEYYKSVIVTLDNGRVVDGCYRNKDKEWWVDAVDGEHYSINATGHVIAWKLLPEPYKEAT